MVRLACLRCASLREESRCPKCKHRTHDLDTEEGQRALSTEIDQRGIGRFLLATAVVVWGSAVPFAIDVLTGESEVTSGFYLPLIVGTPVLLSAFAFGFRVQPLEALRGDEGAPPPKKTRRRWWQRDRGPTRF